MSSTLENKTPEVVTLRITMRQRGMTTARLAALIGIHRRSLENFFSRPERSEPTQYRIEKILDVPIWSSVEEHQRRKTLGKLLGFDLPLATFRQLQFIARDYHVIGWSRAGRKADLISLIGRQLLERKRPALADAKQEGKKK
jgi:hypothetical protein